MDILSVLGQVRSLLRQEERLSYRILRRQFALDEEALDDLKYELIEVQELAVDKDGKMLVWTGGATEGKKGKWVNGETGKDPEPRTPNPELRTFSRDLHASPSRRAHPRRGFARRGAQNHHRLIC